MPKAILQHFVKKFKPLHTTFQKIFLLHSIPLISTNNSAEILSVTSLPLNDRGGCAQNDTSGGALPYRARTRRPFVMWIARAIPLSCGLHAPSFRHTERMPPSLPFRGAAQPRRRNFLPLPTVILNEREESHERNPTVPPWDTSLCSV